MNWFRWYHGTVTDPKMALIAHKSGQPLPIVICVWAYLLEIASQAVPRGSIASFDAESLSVTLVTVTLHINKIVEEMTNKEMIVGGMIGKWGMRQCDPTAAERMRNYRERLKTNTVTVTPVTVTPVTLRNVTPEEKRIYKNNIGHFPNALEIFEKCWAEYPRKIGKDSAMKHFNSQVKNVEEARQLFASIQNYIDRNIDTDPKYIKHGSAFFNKLWRDYVE